MPGGRVHFQVLIGFGGHFQIRVFWWVSLLFMKVEQGSDVQELKLNVTSVNSKHQSYLHNCIEGMWSTSEPSLACRRYFFSFFRQRFSEKASISPEKCQKLAPVCRLHNFFVRIIFVVSTIITLGLTFTIVKIYGVYFLKVRIHWESV